MKGSGKRQRKGGGEKEKCLYVQESMMNITPSVISVCGENENKDGQIMFVKWVREML